MLTSLILFFALFFFPLFAFSKDGHVYLGAQVGPSFAKLSKKDPQISYISGVLITDAYPLNHKQLVAVILNVNGGYEFTGANWKPAIALGLGVYFNPQRLSLSRKGDRDGCRGSFKHALSIIDIKL